jgi:hypothetical protein
LLCPELAEDFVFEHEHGTLRCPSFLKGAGNELQRFIEIGELDLQLNKLDFTKLAQQ